MESITSHDLSIGSGGVTLSLDNPDPQDRRYLDKGLLLLSPGEAVEFAREILAHEQELEAQEVALQEQYEQVSQTLLKAFSEQWEPQQPSWAIDERKLDQALYDAYTQLVTHVTGQVSQWYRNTWTDRFSHEQHEALFWRYFHSQYRKGLIEKYFPEEE